MDGRIDLERARRDAKALLRAARAGEMMLRSDRAPVLADAQREVARSLGYASWPALVRDDALVAAARAGRADEVYRLLVAGATPAAGRAALETAAALGLPDVVDVLIGWMPIDRSGVASDDPVVARMLAPREPAEDRELAELMWTADAAWCAAVARVAERRICGDGFAFRTGRLDNTRNGVVCSEIDDLGEVLAWLGRAPGRWLIGPGSSLGERLSQAGCRPERSAVFMAGELSPERSDEVVAADDLVLRRFGERDEASLPLRHHAVSRAGEPVALISTFAVPGALVITHLEVVPGWRRQGIGRALVQHVADGLVLAAPTPASVSFYERLGFRLLRCLPDRTFYTAV
jgi:GNAT superfamily N-acetyltransferase